MEKKIFSFLCKGIIPLLLFMCSINTYAQEVRYVQTGYIDQDGDRHAPSSSRSEMVKKLTFSGNYIIEKQPGNPLGDYKWKYHHSEGDNDVFYRAVKDLLYHREVLNDDDIIVVSDDRSLINIFHYFRGERLYTIIYEQQDGDNYGRMSH